MTRARFTTPDGVTLTYECTGSGPAVLWQHGLGAGFDQPRAVFPDLPVTRLTLACRGHEDSDLGPPEDLSIATFAGDALALLDHLGIPRLAAAGGISLGAAIALRLAADRPDRVARLILARPAWLDRPAPGGLAAYAEAGRHLALHGATEGEARFHETDIFRAIEAASPDNAASLRGFFTRPRPETTTALLARLPRDGPGVAIPLIERIARPTLVIGNGEDVAHPLAYAETLARLIPGARLAVIPSKSADPAAYAPAFRAALGAFLADAVP
ncbi:MAG: alpha/beta fold hydrolase [Paracoccaceae bacterium]